MRRESFRILIGSLGKDGLVASDRAYLAQVVSGRAGITPDEAGRRIDDKVSQLRESAETAKKTTASLSIFTALSLFIGAFIAATAAVLGGRRRDTH